MSSGRAEFQCFACGEKLNLLTPISRREECPKCRADVRTCKNCQFYDPKVYNECRETQADPIREKDRSNICDYYAPKTGVASVSQKDALLAAAEALFKKKD
jgi:hypothetical protein